MFQILRFKASMHKHGMSKLSKLLDRMFRIFFKCDFPASVKFGGGLRLTNNGKGTVVHYRTVIGDNVTIGKNVTIGSRNHIGPPQIGDSVWIGNNACLLGDIHIGNHVVIEEDAVVVHSVPSNSYVYGVPARNRELTDKGKESY